MKTHLRRAAAARATEPAPGSIGPDSTPAASIAEVSEDDPLINQAQTIRLVGGRSPMTIWRWRQRGILPPAIVINGRNYNRRSDVLRALQAAAEPTEDGAA